MSVPFHHSSLCAALGILAAVATGCATTAPATRPLAAGQQATIEGRIVSIDTTPWTYDGNAVIQLESDVNGRVSVQLPARWNLCKAPAVGVEALAVGRRARAVGSVGEAGVLVVCERAEHRLQLLD